MGANAEAPTSDSISVRLAVLVLRVMRLACWVLALLVPGGYAMCVWAVIEFNARTDATRGEVLMVLPGTAFMLLCFGGMSLFAAYALRRTSPRWERMIFLTTGILGVLMFPGIAIIDFLNLFSV
jgi:hypothetical protein